jgi:hypothetical protein
MSYNRNVCNLYLFVLVLSAVKFAFAGLPDPIFADNFEAHAVSYRFSDMDLRDPHVFVAVPLLGCRDLTDTAIAGFSVNATLQTNIQTDADGDGFLDLSYVQRLRPLDQTNNAIGESDFVTANCSAPLATTSCAADAGLPLLSVYTSKTSGTCLAPTAGTTHPYALAIVNSVAPCFSTTAGTVTINLSGIPITLQNARVAATYANNPATSLTNGLLTGFISEADANATILPTSLPLIGGQTLSSLLPGGTGNCSSGNDKDMVNGVSGWQFYLNFTATKVDYSE